MSAKTHVYRRLLSLVKSHIGLILLSTLAALIYVVLNSASIWLTATLLNNILTDFDELVRAHAHLKTEGLSNANDYLKFYTNEFILKTTPMETLKVLCITILVVFGLKNLFLYLKNITLAFVQLKMIQGIRDRLYEHLHSLSLTYFNKKQSGELTSIIINDVSHMRQALSTSFQKLFIEPINILMMVILLFVISWKLALIAILIIPVSGTVIVWIGRSIRRKSRRTASKIANITNIITETLSSIRIVKAFVMSDYEVNRFKKQTQHHFKLLYRRARLRHLAPPVTETIGVIIGAVLLWVGGREVLVTETITSEDFLRFILILFSTFTPVRNLSNVNANLQIGVASAERVFRIMDTRSELHDDPEGLTTIKLEKELRFDHVGFSYENGDDSTVEDVSFSVEKGQIIALVGQSGAGKSTVADLIPRFYDVNSGSITIDGVDIRKYRLNTLRNLMGIVTQDTILFDDTILNNIAYGDTTIDLEKVTEAAKAANALEFIQELPDGFESRVGENGVNLSGGQKQRIAIARALLLNPPLLILDEATSSLDTESEREVQRAIESLLHHRTVIVIAHRLSTVVNADNIIVMQNGRILDQGKHDDLMGTCDYYNQLFTLQNHG